MHNITSKILSLSLGLMPMMALTIKHGVNISAAIILLTSIIVLLIHFPVSLRLSNKEKVLIVAMLCLPLIILSDVMFRGFRWRYFDYYARFIIVFPIYFALRQATVSIKPFVIGILIGAVGVGLLAIYQQYYIGAENVHGFVIKISFGNISLLLGMMSLASLFLIKQYQYKKVFFISCLFAFFMGLIASALSGSRGGWVALPLLIALFMAFFPTRKLNKLVSILLLLGLMVATYHTNTNVTVRVNSVFQEMNSYFLTDIRDNTEALQVSSIGLRLEVWRAAWLIFKEHPIIGVGSGEFNAALQEKVATGEVANIFIFDHAHSEPLHLLTILGLIGFIGYGILYAGLLYYFYCSLLESNNERQYLSFLGLLVVGGSLIFGLTNYSFGHQVNVVFLAVMTVCLAGMISSLERSSLERG
jgi:O-antigen ligase